MSNLFRTGKEQKSSNSYNIAEYNLKKIVKGILTKIGKTKKECSSLWLELTSNDLKVLIVYNHA